MQKLYLIKPFGPFNLYRKNMKNNRNFLTWQNLFHRLCFSYVASQMNELKKVESRALKAPIY